MERTSALLCERMRAYVSLEVDGELADLEQAMLEAHVAQCATCSAYRADVHGFTRELRSAPHERLERRVALPRVRSRIPLRALQAAAAAASVAAAFVVVTAVGTRSEPSVRTTSGEVLFPGEIDTAAYVPRAVRPAAEDANYPI